MEWSITMDMMRVVILKSLNLAGVLGKFWDHRLYYLFQIRRTLWFLRVFLILGFLQVIIVLRFKNLRMGHGKPLGTRTSRLMILQVTFSYKFITEFHSWFLEMGLLVIKPR